MKTVRLYSIWGGGLKPLCILHTELQWLTSRSGSCTSLLWWSTDVSRTKCRSICRTVCQSLKLPGVSNCGLPIIISFYWSHDIVSEHSAVGLLLWLARRSGTHWQMNCELTLVIGLNQLWRLSSLPLTSVFSALEAFTAMCYINWCLILTYGHWYTVLLF